MDFARKKFIYYLSDSENIKPILSPWRVCCLQMLLFLLIALVSRFPFHCVTHSPSTNCTENRLPGLSREADFHYLMSSRS